MILVSPLARYINACLTKILYNMATKLISLRIEENLLKKVDDYCDSSYYRNRSWCINRILERVLRGDYRGTLWKIEFHDDEIKI